MPDSESVNDIEPSRIKVMYVVKLAIAPYFKIILVDFVKKTYYFAILLDESLNEYTQLYHMDFLISYWFSKKEEKLGTGIQIYWACQMCWFTKVIWGGIKLRRSFHVANFSGWWKREY